MSATLGHRGAPEIERGLSAPSATHLSGDRSSCPRRWRRGLGFNEAHPDADSSACTFAYILAQPRGESSHRKAP